MLNGNTKLVCNDHGALQSQSEHPSMYGPMDIVMVLMPATLHPQYLDHVRRDHHGSIIPMRHQDVSQAYTYCFRPTSVAILIMAVTPHPPTELTSSPTDIAVICCCSHLTADGVLQNQCTGEVRTERGTANRSHHIFMAVAQTCRLATMLK